MRQEGHLISYDVTLTVQAPLFIGSGEKVGKTEYIYLPKDSKVLMLDLKKLANFLTRKRLLQNYEMFLMDSLVKSYKKNIATFFYDNNVKPQEYREFTAYSIDGAGETIQKENLREVYLFTKDGQGLPYIPGSSLKGAFRTAILTYLLVNDEELNANDEAERKNLYMKWMSEIQESNGKPHIVKKNLARETKNLETNFLHKKRLQDDKTALTDMVNSAMRGISVSDSTPINLCQLMLAQKVDYSVAGKPQQLPIFRECLRPNTTCQFTVTVDQRMAAQTGMTMEFLLNAITLHQQWQQKYFYAHFKGHEQQDVDAKALVLWLGGGVGFANKTIVHPALGSVNALAFDSELLGRLFPSGNHDKDIDIGISPHMQKLAGYQGELYRMGQCMLEVQ